MQGSSTLDPEAWTATQYVHILSRNRLGSIPRTVSHYYQNHGPTTPATERPLEFASDWRHWVIPQVVYTAGRLQEITLPPATHLNILVGDLLDPGRLAQLRKIDLYRSPAFPDTERQRVNKKFTVRFAVSHIT